jgi:transcriptional regulator with XRE-family HTH domain
VAVPEREPGLREQLREAIRASGQNLNQLSIATGIGRDRLSRFVRGERGISLEAAERICNVLGLKLAEETPLAPKRPRKADTAPASEAKKRRPQR